LDNIAVIRTLTLYGDSLKKLHKFLPENCIKTIPKYGLEINISGVLFSGKDDNSYTFTNRPNRDYTKDELIALQELAIKCYTYPFGGIEFSFGLNIFSNEETEKIMRALFKQYKIEHLVESLDSEGRIDLKISDVKDFSKPSFIDFILELQTLTYSGNL
jgi:hypothetical protein